MHFQVINDNYYNGIIEKIDKFFPTFNSVFSKDDGVYPILGELGTYIINNFKNETIKKSSIDFINEAIEKGGSETEDAIVLQLFQKFYENNTLVVQIREMLHSKALFVFDKYNESEILNNII